MKEKIFKNIGYLVVLINVAIYFIASYLFVENFQTDITYILFNGGLLFIGSFISTTAMIKQGLLNGGDAKKYQETSERHIKQKQKIFPNLPYLQPWLDSDYEKLMKIGRSVFINSAGYDYSELFTETGKIKEDFKVKKPEKAIYKKWYQKPIALILRFIRWIFSEDWRVYRERKSFVRKAKRYKISRSTVSDLMNINADKDPNDYGITENQYMKRQSGLALLSRMVFSFLLPCVSFGFYGFDLNSFFVQLLNIILILFSSIFSLFSAYVFKVKTHRASIIKKINKLEEFENADLTIFKQKSEEKKDGTVHTEKSLPTKGSLVEEARGDSESRQENNICSNPDSGV
ncbi:MAG: hypothetical protein IJX25_00275 [Clostridia bacterium]|nr:hypothetical protein [Clostridia bacterium]